MAQRLITSGLGLVVFFLALFAGQTIFTGAICIVTFGMIFELYRTLNYHRALNVTGVISVVILLISLITGGVLKEMSVPLTILIYLGVMVALHTVVTYKEVAAHAFLTIFITLFFGTIINVYNDFGVYAVLLIFVCAWTTDSGAYFTGMAIGKHKLIPKVSPKKTVEGAVGGVITAVVCCLIYMYIMVRTGSLDNMGYISITVLALFASVCSQLGDLVASSVKRDCNAKDFGNLLPGHGGLLDRFDSVIYITPVIYYIMKIVSQI